MRCLPPKPLRLSSAGDRIQPLFEVLEANAKIANLDPECAGFGGTGRLCDATAGRTPRCRRRRAWLERWRRSRAHQLWSNERGFEWSLERLEDDIRPMRGPAGQDVLERHRSADRPRRDQASQIVGGSHRAIVESDDHAPGGNSGFRSRQVLHDTDDIRTTWIRQFEPRLKLWVDRERANAERGAPRRGRR